MKNVLIIISVFFLTCNNSSEVFSQKVILQTGNTPKYDSSTSYGFNGFIRESFINSYNIYFLKACDPSYSEVKFKIDNSGTISNIEIPNSPKYITEFLNDVLIKANGKFKPAFDNKELTTEAKVFILPVFFNFTENCSIPGSSRLREEQSDLMKKISGSPVYKGDYILKEETTTTVLLWPVICNGPFICRNAFDVPKTN